MHGTGKYTSTDSASCIEINLISKEIKELILKTSPEIPQNDKGHKLRQSKELLEKMEKAMVDLEIEGQKFEYYSYPNFLGGVRWFFKCPGCSKRFLKLYKPTLEPEKVQKYLCTECHDLKTPSALYGPSHKYTDIIRPQKQLEKIRRKIKNTKRISDSELRGLMEEHDRIKREMEASPTWLKMRFSLENDGMGARNAY
jgi:hypothetical protein